MRLFLYILLYCGLISCGKYTEQYARYQVFPEEKTLQSEIIPLDTILFRYPFRVTVRDSIALVLDLHNADYYLHAFSFPEWKHIVSFGKRGEGPEEMLSAETFQFDSLDSIWVLDANRMQITDHYIYTVFHGRTFKNIQAAYQKGEKPESGGRYIYVFDLEGNPVKKYTLDRAIYGIDVDELTNTIIATDVNSNNPIIKFSI
jgi:hypothetical protein